MKRLLVRPCTISRHIPYTQKPTAQPLTNTKTLVTLLSLLLSLVLPSYKTALADANSDDGQIIQQTGSLLVTILPQQAIDAGAQWRIDEGPWQDSNDIVTGLTVGTHRVEYKTVFGWSQPPDDIIQINDGLTTSTSGTYIRQKGSLKVVIYPQQAIDVGAQWRIEGGQWYDSGHTEPNLFVGPHNIEFKDIGNYFTTPDTQTVQIYHAQTTFASGSYIPTGLLRVTILPREAVDANARWRVDGGPWHDSNDIQADIMIGSHTVEFKTIFGWFEPNNQTVNINYAQTTTATGIYVRQIGALNVTIAPQAAIDAGAKWRVDSGTWRDSNDTEPNLPVGFHLLEYKHVTNYIEPNSETILVNYGPTTTTSGTYIPAGSLQVTISPPEAIDDGAQWRIDGGPWHDSNDIETNLAVGTHTLEYRQIDNFNEPNSETILINFAQTTKSSGTYIPAGSLQVVISPQEVVDANAQWRVDDGPWHDSNHIQTHLSVGSHTVEYKPVYSWFEPNSRTVQIEHAQTTVTTGNYIRKIGALQVTISPQEVVDAGAMWRVAGRTWRDSNEIEPNIPIGLYTVDYKPVTNWIKPDSHTVRIDYLQTTAVSETYVPSGTVQVTISPQQAVDAGARWRVDGGQWRNSGSISRSLPVGLHTVDYKSLPNWNEPNSHSVQINHGQITTTTGTYIFHTGSLQVIISPQEAIDEGAKWRVDAGPWHGSEDIEPNLNVGFHTVEYKPLGSAWIAPAKESVRILNAQTTVTTITYIKRKPSGPPPLKWQSIIGGSDWDYGESVQQTSDGGYITVGHTYSGTTLDYDIYLIKSEPNGNIKWQNTFGGDDWDRAFSVQQTSDGGYIIAGFTYSYGTGESDVYLLKVDSSGNQDWDQYFGGDFWDEGYSVRQTSDQGYIIVGSTYSFGAGEYDVYLIKTQSNGHKQYEKTFGGTGDDNAWSVCQTTDGGYIITGYTESFIEGGRSIYLIKTDPATEIVWQKTIGRSDDDVGYFVQQTQDGGYIIAGYTTDYCHHLGQYQYDTYLIKTDANADLQWAKTYPGSADLCSGDDIGYFAQQTADGGYIVAGETHSYGSGNADIYLVRTDPNGNKLWHKAIGDTAQDYAMAIQQTTDDGFILAGTTYSTTSMDFDIYLVKTCPDGTSSADFNCNGIVDYEDLEILCGQYLQSPTFPSADIYPQTGDGMVNDFDFDVLAHEWLIETIGP
ncbi:MAG: hypothetical protein GWN77_06655 [Gammaproteobacteria bacterium]|nr:hypothetical protein [Phycisphaerae bacterium]NIR26631.1 hypothetical protein [Gammaproteobacteria bacterium]NIS54349.1 hypothetical protein [Phycisphaerae bacterium]NIX02160.1 hypothetical protein [Phycisphaerae bacterium]